MDNAKFGSFVKSLRLENHLTQKDLADKLHLTDKAVSKWERGLSFPDIEILEALSDEFDISISELLNGERSDNIGEDLNTEFDLEAAINEAVESALNNKEQHQKKISKIKKSAAIVLLIVFVVFLILQWTYFFFSKSYGFEYPYDLQVYIINQFLLISLLTALFLFEIKNKTFNIIAAVLFILLTLVNGVFMFNRGFENKCIVDYSEKFSNQLILKQNKSTGKTVLFRQYYYFFAKEKEQLPDEASDQIKTHWLTEDVCSVTYTNAKGKLCEYAATYGDRGSGISYYNVSTAIYGEWVSTEKGSAINMLADSKGITINGKTFSYSASKQFGTTAMVLYDNEKPEYIIALNENCRIDSKTGFIERGGTIVLCSVSTDKTASYELLCATYKSDDLTDYKLADVGAYDYKIKSGVLYISYDGENTVEVPGKFSQDDLKVNDYLISDNLTFFIQSHSAGVTMIRSYDKGISWETIDLELKGFSEVKDVIFVNENIGYMLVFQDFAMSDAFGSIKKTSDGGNTWEDVSYGIGDGNYRHFKADSHIHFINERLGYLTMPSGGGESCPLYVSEDGGNSFASVEIDDNGDYDYFGIPVYENNQLSLIITKGSDGDNTEDFVIYTSDDLGKTWNFKG